MIPVPSSVRVLIATRPVDFRKGADSLAVLAKETLWQDPFCGAVLVFRSRRADRVKPEATTRECCLPARVAQIEAGCCNLAVGHPADPAMPPILTLLAQNGVDLAQSLLWGRRRDGKVGEVGEPPPTGEARTSVDQ